MTCTISVAFKKRVWAATVGVGLLTGLSGCAGITETSGAASMRIDIDVYQGPLSMEPEVQWGALYGQVEEGLRRLDQIIYATACVKRSGVSLFDSGYCPQEKVGLIPDGYADLEGQLEQPAIIWDEYRIHPDEEYWPINAGRVKFLCSAPNWMAKIKDDLARAMTLDACAIRNRLELTFDFVYNWDAAYNEAIFELSSREVREAAAREGFTDPSTIEVTYTAIEEDENGVRQAKERKITVAALRPFLSTVLADVAAVAEEMRVLSVYLATSHVGHASRDRRIRTALVDLAAFTSEYGNALRSRADALLKQADGTDRRELPLSVQLREANPTAFLNLYVWNNAQNGRVAGEIGRGGSIADRVRVINRLYTDEAWTRINTAYASGQGDVSMAFVKDDIGNWGLKSFDNDPTSLLRAYRSVGKAMAGAAITLASGGQVGSFSTGDEALKNLNASHSALLLAENIAYGGGAEVTVSQENKYLTRMHTTVARRLTDLQKEYTAEAAKLVTDIDSVKEDLAKARDRVAQAERSIEELDRTRPKETTGKTAEGLRAESLALTSRTDQTTEDEERAQAEINRNNQEISQKTALRDSEQAKVNEIDRELTPLKASQQRILALGDQATPDQTTELGRLNTQVQGLETRRAGPAGEVDRLNAQIEGHRTEVAEYQRIIDNRKKREGELEDRAQILSNDAKTVQDIEDVIAKIRRDTLAPEEEKVKELEARLAALEKRQKSGLYEEALKRAQDIIDNHDDFVADLEALVVEEQTETPSAELPLNEPDGDVPG